MGTASAQKSSSTRICQLLQSYSGFKVLLQVVPGPAGQGSELCSKFLPSGSWEIRVGKRKKKTNTTNPKAPLATSPESQRPCKMSPLSSLMPNSWWEVQNKARGVGKEEFNKPKPQKLSWTLFFEHFAILLSESHASFMKLPWNLNEIFKLKFLALSLFRQQLPFAFTVRIP